MKINAGKVSNKDIFSNDILRNAINRREDNLFSGITATVFGGGGFSPKSIPSLELWLDASSGVYKDAGATAAANEETVQQWNDKSGNAVNASQSTAGTRPQYIASGLIGSKPSIRWTNHRLNTTSFLGAGYNTAFTAFVVAANSATSGLYISLSNGDGTSFQFYLRRARQTNKNDFISGLLSDTTIEIPVVSGANTGVDVVSYNGALKTIAYNGVEVTEAATGNLGLNGALTIGRYTTDVQPFVGDISEVLVYSRALSLAERGAVSNYLSTKYGGLYGTVSRIVFDGNSLTAGTGATAGNTYPEQVMASFTGRSSWNYGVAGQTTTQMGADAAAQIDILKRNLYTGQNVVVAWEITNELVSGVSATDAYNNFVTYCTNRRTAGFNVIALTVLPRTTAGQAQFYADRLEVNTNIRANWSSFADGIADVALDGRIGDDGDQADATYYSDTTHLNDAGYGIVAGIVTEALQRLGA